MKKHLIAAAVAGTLAVPAMAQVTVSGYLEGNYESINNSLSATPDTQGFGTGSFGSSRIVFSGSEDLGGGLKAGFRLESSLGMNGTMGSGTVGAQATTGPIFNRGVELNLSGAFGTVAFGKLDHGGIENNDLNVFGNYALGEAAVVEVGEVASDVNDTIRYTTPSFSGVALNVAFTPEDDGNANTLAGSKGHAGITSYQLTGSVAGVSFRAGGGTVKNAQTAAATSATGDTKVMGLAASYDFGAAAVAVFYQKQDNPTAVDGKNTIVSVKVPLGSGLDVRGLYETVDTGTVTTKQKNYMVAAVKALSKRTNVYGYYRSVDVNGAAGNDVKTTGVALSHSF